MRTVRWAAMGRTGRVGHTCIPHQALEASYWQVICSGVCGGGCGGCKYTERLVLDNYLACLRTALESKTLHPPAEEGTAGVGGGCTQGDCRAVFDWYRVQHLPDPPARPPVCRAKFHCRVSAADDFVRKADSDLRALRYTTCAACSVAGPMRRAGLWRFGSDAKALAQGPGSLPLAQASARHHCPICRRHRAAESAAGVAARWNLVEHCGTLWNLACFTLFSLLECQGF